MSDLLDPTDDDYHMYGGHNLRELSTEAASRAQTLPHSYRQRASTLQPGSRPRPQPRPRHHNDSSERREGERMVSTSEPSSKQPGETGQAILLHNVEGTKYDGGIESATLQQSSNVINGELLTGCEVKGRPYNYRLHRDPNTYLVCEQDVVAPLSPEGFLLLEAIKTRGDRLEAYRHRLEWGLSLEEGSQVAVTTSGFRYSMMNVPAVVHYKGTKGKNPGTFFGVEILDEIHQKARTSFKDSDGTFQGQRYFTCAPGAGIFVTLEQISPVADTKGRRGSIPTKDKPPMRGRSQTSAGTLTLNRRSFSGMAKRGEASNRSHQEDLVRELKQKQNVGTADDTSLPPNRNNAEVSQSPATGGISQQEHKKEVEAAPLPRVEAVTYTPVAPIPVPQSNGFDSRQKYQKSQPHTETPPLTSRPPDSLAAPQRKEITPSQRHSEAITPPPISQSFTVVSTAQQAISAAPPLVAVPPCVSHPNVVMAPQLNEPEPSQRRVETVSRTPPPVSQPNDFSAVSNSRQPSRPPSASHCFNVDAVKSLLNKLDDVPAPSPQQAHYDNLGTRSKSPDRSHHKEHRVSTEEDALLYDSFKPNTFVVSSRDRPLSGHSTHGAQSSSYDAPDYGMSRKKQERTSSKSQLNSADQRLELGSLVQLPAADGTPKYGIIRWIGRLPMLQGEIAGIELEEPMNGCTDGTLQSTGQKFFDCAHGRGLFYPLDRLTPDRRYDEIKEDENKTGHDEELLLKIRKLTASNEEKQADIEMYCSVVNEKDEVIQKYSDELHEKDSKLRDKEEEITMFSHTLHVKDEEIHIKNKEIAGLKEETRQLKASLEVNRRQLMGLQEQVRSKTRQMAALQQQLGVQDQLQAPDTAGSWNIPRSEIQAIPYKKEIGRGAWGEVYSARFRGKDVAIKIAHKEIFHESTIDLIKREVRIMSRVQHPNLVRFIAAVWDEAVERKLEAPIIVCELMDINLRVAYSTKDLSSSLISIFRDVAYALHYLHCQGIIHRDISAPNVLLKYSSDRSILAKVSDFGSANMAKQSKTVGAGAVLYSAPEMFSSITSSQKQTSKVDVYSYGVLLLEVTSREMPSHDTYDDMLQVLALHLPDRHKLIVQCTEHSPANRPTMADILNRLC